MDKVLEKSAKSVLVMQRNLFLCLSLFLVVIVLLLSVVAVRKETITLFKTPQTKIDLLSLEKQAHYLTHLILNRSGTTWEAQNASLAEWVAPSFKIPLGAFLRGAQKKMVEENKSFEWELKDSAVELNTLKGAKVFLHGDLKAYIPTHDGTKRLVEQKTKNYVLDFRLSEGKLLLENFENGEHNG